MQEEQEMSERAIVRLRKICLALPEVAERSSHGSPSFFVQDKKCFVMFVDDHHGDGILGVWCAAPPGAQQALIGEAPEWFFKPPYVGHRGWIGLRLDRNLSWDEFQEYIIDAYVAVAPPKFSSRLEGGKLGEVEP